MKGFAFGCFLGFGILTILLAFSGGLWALFQSRGISSSLLGFLLLFLGASLAVMLGSLLVIKNKERNLNKGGKQ